MRIEELVAKLAAPAQRALGTLGLARLEDLTGYAEKEIGDLYGIGPGALATIKQELEEHRLHFKKAGKAEVQKPGSGPDSIDAYIARFPGGTQKRLQELRKAIRKEAPDATEKISYQMPTFYLNGNLVHFAGYEHHIGFYPGAMGIANFEHLLSQYKHAKGSVQFPLDKPLPLELVSQIVRFRVSENRDKGKTRKKA